ncbi:MAG: GntR family transcriptional regulator [Christensenellaceae bacterium]
MEIRLQGKQNVYQNIVEEYKRLIGFGAMKYGERLPSVRALALELGVNPNTVERAYRPWRNRVYPYFAEEARTSICGRRARCRLEG